MDKYIKHKLNKNSFYILGSFNILILIIIFNILFMSLNLIYNNIYIYQKIFHNEKNLYEKHLELDLQFINNTNIETNKLQSIGFIADDLTYLCSNGINAYEVYIDNISYGYWGKREIKKVDYNNINTNKKYYINLITNEGFKVNTLNIIDLYNQNQIDEIFFIDQNKKLWNYNVKSNNFSLQLPTYENIVDYIIANPINNHLSTYETCKYNIYTLHKTPTKDVVMLTYLKKRQDLKATQNTIELFTSTLPINSIYIRANHIITISIYKDQTNNAVMPLINIYKLEHYHKNGYNLDTIDDKTQQFELSCNQLNIPLYPLPVSTRLTVNQQKNEIINPQVELFWNEEFNYHQINIYIDYKIMSYYFKLQQDNDLLTYINIS